ncbi:hypothetical protein HEQ60_04515 [Haematospirillum sp. H1815]|uniref:helix-turn-helix transcriptional regulator n=1 Tax=Haematospirillum sp. H1815 TaxID=2723108 RepID=UPI00143B1FBD|nr:autoinducer binding domain-containing protein [Haematospirillum sp. H1815]NKD77024.1 hypothetical protein [Haematospirillum sp. H1815]
MPAGTFALRHSQCHVSAGLAEQGAVVVEAVKRFEIVNSYKDISLLFQDLLTNCTALGFEFAAFGGIEGEDAVMAETGCPIIAASYPSAWVQRYVQKAYHTIDPVVYLAPVSETTLDWKTVSALNTDFFNEASTFGLRAGLSIPVTIAGRLYLMSFATSRNTAISAEARSTLESMAFNFLQKYTRADRRQLPEPSTPEQTYDKVLQMALSGLSRTQIASDLGISEYYVAQYLRRKISAHSSYGMGNTV